jgi:hypothetical protein
MTSSSPTRTFKDGPLRGIFRQTNYAYACIGLPLGLGLLNRFEPGDQRFLCAWQTNQWSRSTFR